SSPIDLFAPPSKLTDIEPDGTQLFSTTGNFKSISERLAIIWQERGDFSALTAESIKLAAANKDNPPPPPVTDAKDPRPSPQQIQELQLGLIDLLQLAKTELTTALDLLSVLAPITDPPTVDPATLPLPPETLVLVPSKPPPPPLPTDERYPIHAALPVATSLSSIRDSANAFFKASKDLKETAKPNPFPTLLHLHHSTTYPLLPLGARPGATLTGKNDLRSARSVGIFYGCPEAREVFRRGAVARVEDLSTPEAGAAAQQQQTKGRVMKFELQMGGRLEKAQWGGEDERDGVEGVLRARGRTAFAEEIFATLANEARGDGSLKARLVLGKRSTGDSIVLDGHGWSLKITMIVPTSLSSRLPESISPDPTSTSTASALLPLTLLLFLQEYSLRRAPPSTLLWTRPILQTLSVLLSHLHRRENLETELAAIEKEVKEGGLTVEVEWCGEGRGRVRASRDGGVLGESVKRLLKGDKELGGLVVFRVARTRVFHITYSHLLPQAHSTPAQASQHQTLVLQSPLASAPVAVPSLKHLGRYIGEL
ncbi:hypothetical protein P7C70_g9328, partial [Phenoliferia sp. Uapishka_3]